MEKGSRIFLQVVIVLIGIGALTFLLWEPHVEGVNANATTLYQIYFDDPFLAYAYIASIPFFMALYQAFQLLGYVGQNTMVSQSSIRALRTIKHCAIAIIGFIAVGVPWLLLGESDDRPPILAMGTFAILCSIAVATAAARLERFLKNS